MSESNELEALRESIAKLEENNKRLTNELKQARKNVEIAPEQLAEVEAERDALKLELDKAGKTIKEAVKASETAKAQLESETKFTSQLLIDNGLLESLAKNGVTNPVHQKAAAALLKSNVQLVADGDKRVAKVGDKVLADFISEWALGDEGKHFVAAPANSGGNASGSGNGMGGAKTMTRDAFEAMNPADKLAFSKAGGQIT